MITLTNSQFTVEYDSNIMFAYSPNIITITPISNVLASIVVRVGSTTSASSISFNLRGGAFRGVKIPFDASRALRLYDNVQITISIGDVSEVITPYVIQGARGRLEHFGGNYAIRQWEGYPLTVDFLYYQLTEVYMEAMGVTGEIGELSTDNASGFDLGKFTVPANPSSATQAVIIKAEGEEFNNGEWETNYWNYRITPACTPPKNRIYLRWVDKQGLTWYWLFGIESLTRTTTDATSYGRYPLDEGQTVNEWTTGRSLIVERSAKIYATDVTEEEYNVVKTLAESSVVAAYDEEASRWYRVRVKNGSHTEVKGHYKDVDFEIDFSPEQTQLG